MEWESGLTIYGPEGFHRGDNVLKLDCGDGCVTH